MTLDGSRVLITGASTGIGLRVAARLLDRGARVVLTGLPPDRDVRAAAHSISRADARLRAVAMDVRDTTSVLAAVQEAEDAFGGIDILINNAGVASQQLVAEQDPQDAEREIGVNYLGTFRVTHAVLPQMLARRSGMIVNVASTLAKVPGPTQANYAASKAAIAAFSSALRGEVEGHGIAVKVFVPGLTATAMTEGLDVRSPRLLDPDDVAEHMLRALESSRPEYVTGASYRAFVTFGRIFPETARKLMTRFY